MLKNVKEKEHYDKEHIAAQKLGRCACCDRMTNRLLEKKNVYVCSVECDMRYNG